MSSTVPSLTVYGVPTPNGVAPALYLEELKTLYPTSNMDYEVISIDPRANTLKEPSFIKLNPNGQVPVLIDHTRDDFSIFESSAILLYLAQNFDKEHKLWFNPESNVIEYSEMLQWLFFAHGGIAPMQAQNQFFHRFAPEDVPYAKTRYLDETKRLYGVVEIRLKDRDYLAGAGRGKYSIADIRAFPWVNIHSFAMIDALGQFPNVEAWLTRCVAREATAAGYSSVKAFASFAGHI